MLETVSRVSFRKHSDFFQILDLPTKRFPALGFANDRHFPFLDFKIAELNRRVGEDTLQKALQICELVKSPEMNIDSYLGAIEEAGTLHSRALEGHCPIIQDLDGGVPAHASKWMYPCIVINS